MTSLKETILKEFDNLHSKCIATDAQYTDKEMVEILSKVIKRNYEEDRLFIINKLQSIEERVIGIVGKLEEYPEKVPPTLILAEIMATNRERNRIRLALSEIFKGRS